RKFLVPSVRKLPAFHAKDFIRKSRVFCFVAVELGRPGGAKFPPSLSYTFLKMFVYSVGNQKLGIFGPAVGAFREPDFFFAKRLSVRFSRILLVRRTPADVAVYNQERGAI